MIHALGFSPNLFSKFIDSNGIPLKNPTSKFIAPTEKNQTGIDTPNLLKYAQNFYYCSSWDVIPLEDEDSPGSSLGSAGSNFEKSYFFREIMTSFMEHPKIYSGFTWSLLSDSGWYGVDLKNS